MRIPNFFGVPLPGNPLTIKTGSDMWAIRRAEYNRYLGDFAGKNKVEIP
jgi:hypothetical protein